MRFSDLRVAMLADILGRVRSGEYTVRSLSKMAGVSQPHLHHVLAGKRQLSWEMADQLVERLNLDLSQYWRDSTGMRKD
jgi:plasmid maintenance system antidote protein VapI